MRYIAWDTETWAIWDGCLAPPLVCLSLAHERGARLLDKRRGLQWIERALRNERIKLVGHNVSYDLGVCVAAVPALLPVVWEAIRAARIHDTRERESLISIAAGRDDEEKVDLSLAALVQKYLGKDITADKKAPDAWRLRYRELDGVPFARWPQEAKDYPKADAQHTLAVFRAQEAAGQELPNGGNLHDEARAVRNAWVLHLISLWGLRTDPAAVNQLAARVEAIDVRNKNQFRELALLKDDGTENLAHVRGRVVAAYGGHAPLTAKGQVKTDRDTLLESGDEVLAAYGTAGKNDKYKTTYLPKIRKGVIAPINPRFYGQAATTRVTSDYQQLPQKGGVRECHRARLGFVFCSVDYGGLELRTMAQRALWAPEVGYSRMAEALLAKQDLHSVAAAQFMGAGYEDVLARVKAKEPVAEGMRALGKVFNFGKGGGMGPKTLAYHARAKDGVRFCQLAGHAESCGAAGFETVTVRKQDKRVCKVCIEVSTKLDNKWLDAWPEQRALFAISARLHKYGRRVPVKIPYVNVVRGRCSYTQWLNTPFQGLGAVLCTEAMARISEEMYLVRTSPLYGSRLVLNVHDELIAEIPAHSPEHRTAAADRMAFLMRAPAQEILPDLAAAVEAEPALSRVLSKQAQTIRDANGILQIWESPTLQN